MGVSILDAAHSEWISGRFIYLEWFTVNNLATYIYTNTTGRFSGVNFLVSNTSTAGTHTVDASYAGGKFTTTFTVKPSIAIKI